MRVTVLGAGYMGSAMATVARMRGHDVRLWGTWLDDPLLDAVERGEPHPRLRLVLDGIVTLRSARLPQGMLQTEDILEPLYRRGKADRDNGVPLRNSVEMVGLVRPNYFVSAKIGKIGSGFRISAKPQA